MTTLVIASGPRPVPRYADWRAARDARRASRLDAATRVGRPFALPGMAIAAAAFAFLAGLMLVAVVPMAWGAQSLVVVSGSMEPALRVGDVVVVHPVAPSSLRPGDIATFRAPNAGHHLVTHRVRAVTIAGDTVSVTTKGDANNNVENWSVPAAGQVGRVSEHLPALGLLLVTMHAPMLRGFLLLGGGLLLAGLVLQWAFAGARLDEAAAR